MAGKTGGQMTPVKYGAYFIIRTFRYGLDELIPECVFTPPLIMALVRCSGCQPAKDKFAG